MTKFEWLYQVKESECSLTWIIIPKRMCLKKKQCNVSTQFQWVCSQVEKKACEFFTVKDYINAMLESGFSLC